MELTAPQLYRIDPTQEAACRVVDDRFSVAAAVAVIKASWGWEEVNPLLITVAGDPVSVQLEVVNRTWIASMENAA